MKNSNNCKVLGRIDTDELERRQEVSRKLRKAQTNRKRQRTAERRFRANTSPFQGLVIK
jgi:hypothetical protein